MEPADDPEAPTFALDQAAPQSSRPEQPTHIIVAVDGRPLPMRSDRVLQYGRVAMVVMARQPGE
jgi:hypothetical protein